MLLYLVMAQASLLFFDRKPRAHEEEAGARIFIESETYDFGKLEYEGDGSHVFILKNTGNRELLIHRVQGSCSCAIVEWTEEPIMPGKTGQVKVTYHTKRVGRFAKYFTVRSNAINEPEKKLLIREKFYRKQTSRRKQIAEETFLLLKGEQVFFVYLFCFGT